MVSHPPLRMNLIPGKVKSFSAKPSELKQVIKLGNGKRIHFLL